MSSLKSRAKEVIKKMTETQKYAMYIYAKRCEAPGGIKGCSGPDQTSFSTCRALDKLGLLSKFNDNRSLTSDWHSEVSELGEEVAKMILAEVNKDLAEIKEELQRERK